LRLGKNLVEFGIDSLRDLLGQRLGQTIESLAEAKQLEVESGVGGVDGMSGCEALDGKEVLV
jgi:hypothetical protein